MKRITAIAAAVLMAVAAHGAGLPVVVTQLYSNQQMSALTARGLINPNGTNTVILWLFGTDTRTWTGYGTLTVGAGSTNVNVSQTFNSLFTGTRYYDALVASNVYGVVTGAVNAGVTTLADYGYDGQHMDNIDFTRPYCSELVCSYAEALAQFKEAYADTLAVDFDLWGNLKPGVVNYTNLDASVTNLLNELSIATNYPSLYFIGRIDTNGTPAQTYSQNVVLASFPLLSNTFSRIIVRTENKLQALSGANPTFNWVAIQTNGADAGANSGFNHINGPQEFDVPLSVSFPGGNTNTVTITVVVTSTNDNPNVNTLAVNRNLEVDGVR